jgi:hypothetical protein
VSTEEAGTDLATSESIGVVVEVRFEDGVEVRYIRRHKDGKTLRYTQRRDGSWGVPARNPKFTAKRLTNAKPSQIWDELKQACPWLYDVDQQSVDRFLDAESRRRSLTNRLRQMTDEGMPLEDIPTRFWNAVRDAEVNSAKFAQDLGLDPTGRQKLLKDAAWAKRLATESVTQIADRGRRLRAIEE